VGAPPKVGPEAEALDFEFGWLGNKTGQNSKTRWGTILTYSSLR